MEIVVERSGRARCIYAEEIDLAALGRPAIARAGHVEPDHEGRWLADLRPLLGPVLGPFPGRSEAVAAEVAWIARHWLLAFALIHPRRDHPPSNIPDPTEAPPRGPTRAASPTPPGVRVRRGRGAAATQETRSMTQAQLHRSVAGRTGESCRTVRRLGFQPPTAPIAPIPRTSASSSTARSAARPCRTRASRATARRPWPSAPRPAATSTSTSSPARSTPAAARTSLERGHRDQSRRSRRPGRGLRASRGASMPNQESKSPQTHARKLACRVLSASFQLQSCPSEDLTTMITLTRNQARRLRVVFRRPALGIAHRGPIPPMVVMAEGDRLLARHRYAHLAVEHASPLAWPSSGSVALPLEALAELEGGDDSTVALDPTAPDRTVARWSDRGIPRAREHSVLPPGSIAPFPTAPGSWAKLPPGLLDALAEATATAAEDDTRYALSCLALRGDSGTIAAIDGRQALVWSGFAFPWEGEILIPRSPLYASKGLPRDRPVSVGRTDDHVAFRVGPWTIWAEIRVGVRFPDVDRILPGPGSVATRLLLDVDDARFLLDALGRLPGAEEANAPATVDLNGRIAVRARAPGGEPATELILSRSSYSGVPVRFQVNRELLARAIRLGCGSLEVADADSPVAGRSGDRVFAWQPLSKDSAIGPSDDAVRIESPGQPHHQGPPPGRAAGKEDDREEDP